MGLPALGFRALLTSEADRVCHFPILFRQPTGPKYDWCHLPRRLTYAKELRMLGAANKRLDRLNS